MRVRQALEADVPVLAAIAARSYRQAFAGILEPEILAARDSAFFANRFRQSIPRMTVAESHGHVVAFSLVTEGHLDMLFVDPAAQRTGAGTALMEECEARGTRSLECFADNALARSFYEARGWTLGETYERAFAGGERRFVRYGRPVPPA